MEIIDKFGMRGKRVKKNTYNDTTAAVHATDEKAGQDSLAKSIAMHLLPGVLLLTFYFLAGPVAIGMGYPPETAMLLGFMLILVPVELGHLWLKSGRSLSLKEAVCYRRYSGLKQYLIWVPALIVWGFLAWGLTAPAVAWTTQALTGWLPGWFVTASDFSGYSRDVLLVTLGMNIAVNGLIAPAVEELYFRGHLLPRMSRYGRLAPLFSAGLFTLYHLWQPMLYLPVFLAMLPVVYLVWRKQDVRLGIGAHCGLNLIGALLSFAMYLG